MARIAELSFSDLVILPDGTALMKGAPGGFEELMPVAGCEDEIIALRPALAEAFIRSAKEKDQGKEIPATIRFEHDGVFYRVADMCDVYGGQSWFLRRLPDEVPTLEEQGLPIFLREWLLSQEQRQGLVLFSGAQASGKTTTASALLADRLKKYGGHAVTFENPAELRLNGSWGNHGYCFQSEIMGEYELAANIERAHRYASPAIIFIGEIRTKYAAFEVLRTAMGSSRQLVIATIHGLDLVNALERLINWAKELDGDAACHNLASCLSAVLHLELKPKENSRALHVPQFLLLPFSESFKGLRAKLRENKPHLLEDEIETQKNQIKFNRFSK